MGNQLQTVGLMVLLEILWQRVIQNKLRGVRTWVWTDEFSIMFNDDSTGIFRTGDFFEKVYKRIRKHGGVATGATQNISEVIKSKQAMTVFISECVTVTSVSIIMAWGLYLSFNSERKSESIFVTAPSTVVFGAVLATVS